MTTSKIAKPPAATSESLWRSFLKCTSFRFTFYYLLAFYCGMAGAERWPWLAFAVPYWFILSTTTELLNRVADVEADQVNRPERTALCNIVGYGRLTLAARIGYALVVLLGGVWLALVPTIAVAALLVVADFLTFNYSYGLRLCRSRLLSLVALAFPFVGSFSGGWAIAHPHLTSAAGHDFVFHAGPVLLVGGLILGSLSGVKDITDVVGDRLKDGYRSGWLAVVRDRPALVGAAVVTLPSAAVVAFVADGAMALRYLLLLVLFPGALLLANGTRLARHGDERMAVREFFYNYWILVLALLTVLYVHTWAAAVLVAVCLICWRLATVYLHWTSDNSLSWVGSVVRMRAGGITLHQATATEADIPRKV